MDHNLQPSGPPLDADREETNKPYATNPNQNLNHVAGTSYKVPNGCKQLQLTPERHLVLLQQEIVLVRRQQLQRRDAVSTQNRSGNGPHHCNKFSSWLYGVLPTTGNDNYICLCL
jgi:hypothetical protein